jgi:hypothetical protein
MKLVGKKWGEGEGEEWIKLTQDIIRVNMVVYPRVPRETENFLTLLHIWIP